MSNFLSRFIIETRQEYKKAPVRDKLMFIFVLLIAFVLLFYHGFIHTGLIKVPAAKAVDCSAYREPSVYTVEIINDSFRPSLVNAKICDKIKFVNKEDVLHQPATGPHPTHTSYPGFDSLKPLKNGEEYTFTLNRPGSYSFHDHLTPKMTGRVIITK